MNKPNQQSRANINLGNQTYVRGVSDGIAGRPKAIKKSHAHAHRYHAGYRHGNEQRLDLRRWSNDTARFKNDDGVTVEIHGEGAKQVTHGGLLSRIIAWLRP